jgi:hypothetical protein
MHVLAVVAQGHRLGRRAVLDVTELADEPLLRLNSTFASHAGTHIEATERIF